MLNKITAFFEQFIVNQNAPTDPTRSLNMATAALLTEMITIDNRVTNEEETKLKDILISQYGLAKNEVAELLELARQELTDATDYYQFTSLINRHFEQPQKVQMVEQLWKIALADGTIDSHEEHYLRKVADLLFVPHSIFIQCKLKALQEASHT